MRRNTRKVDIIIIAVIVLLTAGGVLLALLSDNGRQSRADITADMDGDGKITYTDYIGKRVGILTGSSFEEPTFDFLPDSEYLYYDTLNDLILALQQDKIDCFICDEPIIRMAHLEQPDVGYLSEVLRKDYYSFTFPKNSERSDRIMAQFNEMLAELTSDGTLEKMINKWFSEGSGANRVDFSGLTGENGTLKIATVSTNVPFSMVADGELTGYSIELVSEFCRRYGYDCTIDQTTVASALAGVSTGIYDILASCATVTEERKESMNFCEPIYEGGIALAVKTSDISGTDSSEPSVSGFNGKRAGVITGSMHDQVISRTLPESPLFNYNNYSDLTVALKTDQIDFFISGLENAIQIVAENPDLAYLEAPLESIPIGAMFAKTEKGAKLRDQFNEFLRKLYADGTRDEIYEYWMSDEAEGKYVDHSDLTGENGTLVLATAGSEPPLSFISNGEPAGTEPDIAVRFCREYGYGIDIQILDFGGMIPGLVQGMYDFVLNDVVITEERKESVYFSDPYNYANVHLIIRKADAAGAGSDTGSGQSWFEGIAASFEKNFIREDRWKQILEGIGTTCLITVLSALFGSVLGFLICMFRRTGSRLANAISNIYVKLLQGTPIVVLLMILYYILLGKIFASVWVAIIGFSLNFGAYASEIMRSGIESIDGGQREAALALGYNENQAFFKFIFPQAAVRFIPVYKQEIVSLLKSTSIVGYIAIQDLTKMSDIIRSRTYEAFFPLIATAVIYFILAWMISLVLKIILNVTDKRHRRAGASY